MNSCISKRGYVIIEHHIITRGYVIIENIQTKKRLASSLKAFLNDNSVIKENLHKRRNLKNQYLLRITRGLKPREIRKNITMGAEPP